MYKKNNGFTLVELIVVLTILAILSTLWFVAYVDYLKSVRDSSRIQQMTSLYDAITLYSSRASIPISTSDWISVLAWTGVVGYQWFINQNLRDAIKYSDGWVDPKTNEDYTYFISADRKHAQILWFFEENNRVNISLAKNIYANNVEYDSLFPHVVGEKLWVIIENDTQIPIQKFGNDFDILSATWSYDSLISSSDIVTWVWTDLIGMIPWSSCKKILSSVPSAESWIYKINPDWTGQFDVYCDMVADGGWWTYWIYVNNNASSFDVFFNSRVWTYDPNRGGSSSTYSIDISKLYHTEMLILYNTPDIMIAEETDNLLKFEYDLLTPWFYLWPIDLPNWNAFFNGGWSLRYSTSISWNGTVTTRPRWAGWGIGTIWDVIPYIIRISEWPWGVFKFEQVWDPDNTSSSSLNAAYIYVR